LYRLFFFLFPFYSVVEVEVLGEVREDRFLFLNFYDYVVVLLSKPQNSTLYPHL